MSGRSCLVAFGILIILALVIILFFYIVTPWTLDVPGIFCAGGILIVLMMLVLAALGRFTRPSPVQIGKGGIYLAALVVLIILFVSLRIVFQSIVSNFSPQLNQNTEDKKLYAAFNSRSPQVLSVAWSPDGKYIVTGGTSNDSAQAAEIQIWDIETGKPVLTYRTQTGEIDAVSWSPDGEYIASGSHTDATVHVWDAKTGNRVSVYNSTGAVEQVSWSPDGKLIAVSTVSNMLQIFDPYSGNIVKTFSARTGFFNAFAWSPDGSRVVYSDSGDVLIILDAQTGSEVGQLEYSRNTINFLAWSPNGQYIAGGGKDGSLWIWEVSSGKISKSDSGGSSGDWSPNSKYIVTANGSVNVVDPSTGKVVETYSTQGNAVTVAWSKDGRYIASGDNTGVIRIWKSSL